MTDQLRARFLRPFLEMSRQRIGRCQALIRQSRPDPGAAAKEMHAMAGEAALIGFEDVARLAREVEATARTWAGGDATGSTTITLILAALEAALDALAR